MTISDRSDVPQSTQVLPYGRDIEVFFDGQCPLCRREIAMLRRRDRLHRIQFTDILQEGFDPAPLGLTLPQLEAAIHGRLPDGTIVRGVEVFRRLYTAIGWGWLAQVTTWPVIRQIADATYTVFARNRLRWTGRCKDGVCALPAAPRET